MTDVGCCQHPDCGRIDPLRSMFVLREHEHTIDELNGRVRVCSRCKPKVKA